MINDRQLKKEITWPAIGNARVVEFLDKSIKSNKLAQAYAFIGPEELGKTMMALSFIENVQGKISGFNSDLYILEPEEDKRNISINQVRDFIKNLNLSSFLNSYKIGLIKQAELLSEEAKSALLKTLEEPKEKVIIILLITSEKAVPATILSRLQKLYFETVASSVIYDYLIKEHKASRSLAKDLANLVLGKPIKALYFLQNPEAYKDYLNLVEQVIGFFALKINDRLNKLETIFSNKSYGSPAVESANDLLNIFESLLRDLLLLNLSQKDYLQYSVFLSKLENLLVLLGDEPAKRVDFISSRLNLISQARTYLASNVNPRSVLEQLIINL